MIVQQYVVSNIAQDVPELLGIEETAYLYDSIIFIPSEKPIANPVWALKVSPNTIAASLHLGFLLKDDRADSMQSDRIPDKLQPVLIPILGISLALQKAASSVRTVDFKPLVGRDDVRVWWVADGEAQVVQDGSDGVGLTVAILEDLVGDDKA